MPSRILLMGCVASKRPGWHEARDLYNSQLWTLRRRWAEEQEDAIWYILSAKHGLLEPTEIVECYDQRLSMDGIYWWSRAVADELLDRHGPIITQRIEVHAGAAYAAAMKLYLAVLHPLEGLPIGKQLQWYVQNTKTQSTLL